MSDYRNPALTVDIIIEDNNQIVLIKRKNNPYKGIWALPGGFVDYGEKVEDAARREAYEETSLNVELTELVGVYSDFNRDPRGHTVSITYKAKIHSGTIKAADDATEAKYIHVDELSNMTLAFDHQKMLKDAGLIK